MVMHWICRWLNLDLILFVQLDSNGVVKKLGMFKIFLFNQGVDTTYVLLTKNNVIVVSNKSSHFHFRG